MPSRSRFTPRVPQAPAGRKLSQQTVRDLRGLNSTDPYSILEDSASPYLRNARMYLPNSNRQVAISTRNGSIEYSTPIGESLVDSETSTVGAAEQSISSVQWLAQSFTSASEVRLTQAEVNIRTDVGTAPIIVHIYDDDAGKPGNEIATSSYLNSDVAATFDYVSCRFVEAPTIAVATTYWIVVSIQEAESNQYKVSTTTNSTDAAISTDAGNNWTLASYSLNVKLYGSTPSGVLGATRYYPSSASFETIFAHGQDVYTIDDNTGATTSLIGSLSASASRYRYAQFRDKLYIANAKDKLKEYNGSTVVEPSAIPGVPYTVVSHKNRLFITVATDRNRIEFSELADATTWESTSFIYAPEPGSSDPITALISFQDSLVIFTRNDKYVLSGSDLGNFQVREALGREGAVSQEAVTSDENYVYFVSSDGHMYRWNGSKDEQLSRKIEGDFDNVADINESRLTLHNDRIMWCFQRSGSTSFSDCFVYETRYDEWFYDTGRYVLGGIIWYQEGNQLILASDRVGALYRASDNFTDLGRPIDFEYRTNYFDFNRPDNFKQVRRLYLHFRKTNWVGTISVGTDTDFQDDPIIEQLNTQLGGEVWGEFVWGSFIWGGDAQYLRHRMNVAGQSTHFQIRIKKNGVETPVYFIKHSMHYRGRRPA